jgi:hypothetical protein
MTRRPVPAGGHRVSRECWCRSAGRIWWAAMPGTREALGVAGWRQHRPGRGRAQDDGAHRTVLSPRSRLCAQTTIPGGRPWPSGSFPGRDARRY